MPQQYDPVPFDKRVFSAGGHEFRITGDEKLPPNVALMARLAELAVGQSAFHNGIRYERME
jgi:hypothetical protein